MTLERAFGYIAVLVIGIVMILFVAECQFANNRGRIEQIKWREAVSKARGSQFDEVIKVEVK